MYDTYEAVLCIGCICPPICTRTTSVYILPCALCINIVEGSCRCSTEEQRGHYMICVTTGLVGSAGGRIVSCEGRKYHLALHEGFFLPLCCRHIFDLLCIWICPWEFPEKQTKSPALSSDQVTAIGTQDSTDQRQR